MPTPRVSIVTRTRNRPGFLARCLASVGAQTFTDYEHLVVNDAGDAQAVDAAVQASPRAAQVRVEHRPVSSGMEAAANTGLHAARGSLLALLDDDDTWAPDFLAQMVAAFDRPSSPAVKGVVCRTLTVHEEEAGGHVTETSREPFNPGLDVVGLEALCVENAFTNNAFLLSREAAGELGGFDERLQVYGDWDFNLRFLLRHDIDVLPRALAHYHRRGGAASDEALNSFQRQPAAAARYRAVLTTLWLRGEGGRDAPAVATLLALGPIAREQSALAQRIDKYLNALHRLRHAPGLRQVERLLFGR